MHLDFMRRCLTLAEQGRGKTGTNPMVGAVIVRDGKVIAEGWHRGFGQAHAERDLLQRFDPTSPSGLRGAGQKIEPSDVLYVNLEPCSHTKKKTPPCTEILLERGVKTVVFGMKDPNPAVNGEGIEYLNKNGIQTFGPILAAESMRLNRGFISLMTKHRPWITVKKAKMRDGGIAKPDGSPLKITNEEQDTWSHASLRAKHDAILVGVGTVLRDNPSLTARFDAKDGPQPTAIILDPELRTPLASKAVRSGTIIVVSPGTAAGAMKSFEDKGVSVLRIAQDAAGFVWSDLWHALTTPREDFYGIASILVEGGPRTWEIFKKAGIVDEEVTLIGE